MDFTILQWNMNGYLNNYNDLQLLIKELDPSLVALQETHLAHNLSPIPPKNYSSYFVNSPSNTSSKQGTGILINSKIPHKTLPINSEYQVVAIEIQLDTKITVLSFYVPPNQEISISSIVSIISTFNTPLLILGDFNGWNTLWGSTTNNKRGILLESIIHQTDLCILNDGRPTHFSSHNSFTNIDLSLCSLGLLPITSWSVLDDLHNSDHFPISISIRLSKEPSSTARASRFRLHLADWTIFQTELKLKF